MQDHRRKPKPLESASQERRLQLTSKMKASSPLIPWASESRVVEIANAYRCRHLDLVAPRGAQRCAMRKRSREVIAQFFCHYGLPSMLTFDNDPRFVGSPSGRDFPSAKVAISLVCGGHTRALIPPHRPDKKCGTLERFHRSSASRMSCS